MSDPGSSAPDPVCEPDYRFTLANERTFLAWQRTALGLLAAAVALLHFAPVTELPGIAYGLGGLLGSVAVATAAGGLHRWRANDRAIRRDRPLPASRLTTVLAVVLTAAGITAVIMSVSAAS
ncbi:YidH family protein [Nocardia nova]|uniref:YidH family protein n=1 Tax=Nocardia nova TaxID=37330 RepID=UPI00340E275F